MTLIASVILLLKIVGAVLACLFFISAPVLIFCGCGEQMHKNTGDKRRQRKWFAIMLALMFVYGVILIYTTSNVGSWVHTSTKHNQTNSVPVIKLENN